MNEHHGSRGEPAAAPVKLDVDLGELAACAGHGLNVANAQVALRYVETHEVWRDGRVFEQGKPVRDAPGEPRGLPNEPSPTTHDRNAIAREVARVRPRRQRGRRIRDQVPCVHKAGLVPFGANTIERAKRTLARPAPSWLTTRSAPSWVRPISSGVPCQMPTVDVASSRSIASRNSSPRWAGAPNSPRTSDASWRPCVSAT